MYYASVKGCSSGGLVQIKMSISSALSSLSYKEKKNQTKQITQEMLFMRLLSEQGRKERGIPLSLPSSYTVLQEEEGMMLKSAQLPLKDQGARLMASTWYFSRRFACLSCLYLLVLYTCRSKAGQQGAGWLWSRRQEGAIHVRVTTFNQSTKLAVRESCCHLTGM